MSQKEAIYILVALGAVATVYFLVIERSREDDCGCEG